MVAASSALPATSPAGCIWQQYARQQIAATCRRACRRAYYREQAARLPAAAHAAVALQPRNYRKKLPPARLSPRNLPPRPTCRSYYRAYRRGATAEELPPCNLPPTNLPTGLTTARWVLPRDGSRAQRAGDSDVGANDKGAGDDPGDWVDAH